MSPPPPSRGGADCLFGEILPEESDSLTAGYGIDGGRSRRTSESSAQNPARKHLRSHSNPDLEPPSPTDWYRGAHSQQAHDPPRCPTRAQRSLASPQRCQRSEADDEQLISAPGGSKRNPSGSPANITLYPGSQCRSEESTARWTRAVPPPSRSNSPVVPKQTLSGRTSRQHGPPTMRAKTPTNRSQTPTLRAKTPTQTHRSSRKAPPSSIGTPSNGRLNAYVTAPPPKLSPTLRSSRPRQSVATATTAASRMKVVGPQSPQRPNRRDSSRPAETSGRRRKISVGPIDLRAAAGNHQARLQQVD